MWLRDSSISVTILNAWSLGHKSEPIATLWSFLRSTKLALKWLNHTSFGNVQNSTLDIKSIIETLQILSQTEETLEKERNLQNSLDELLQREQIMW